MLGIVEFAASQLMLLKILRQIWVRSRVFHKFAQAFHHGWARKKFAKNIDFVAQFTRGQWLDESLRCRGRDAIELCRLGGSEPSHAQRFAFRRHLAYKAYGKPFRGIDAATGEEKIAHHPVADVALQAWNAAETGDQT
jgi:hypothetical protein